MRQAIAFLDEFLVVKVASSKLSQQVWDHAIQMSEAYALPLGSIRQQAKEVSNDFSQRFHLPHVVPQIAYIFDGRLQSVWSAEEALSASLSRPVAQSASTRKQLYGLWAYRKLEAVCEASESVAGSCQVWFDEWFELISKACLDQSLQVLVESFRAKWYPLCQSSWNEISMAERALFIKECCLLKEKWIQKIKRQGRL